MTYHFKERDLKPGVFKPHEIATLKRYFKNGGKVEFGMPVYIRGLLMRNGRLSTAVRTVQKELPLEKR